MRLKKIRIVFIGICLILFYTIFISSTVRNIYLSDHGGEKWFGGFTTIFKTLAELPSDTKKLFLDPEYLISNITLKDGFTYYVSKDSLLGYPKLLISYKRERFDNIFELLDIKTGKTLKKWIPDSRKISELTYNKSNTRALPFGSDYNFTHPLLAKDSSLFFTTLHSLVKIDKNSKIIWVKNDREYHHSIESDDQGNIYVCTAPFKSAEFDFLPEKEKYREKLLDDEITKIDAETGKAVFSKSVLKILEENGYENLILAKGLISNDPIHLNDIQPATTNSDFWLKGDLLVSSRHLSLVFLYRPTTNKILWLKEEPWYNQHDCDFFENNKVVVFGNDVIREETRIKDRISNTNSIEGFLSKKRPYNQVYIYDCINDTVYTPYKQMLKQNKIKTLTRGRCDILSNGDLFVEETDAGRTVFGDSTNKKIEFARRINNKKITSLNWSRVVY